MVPFEERPDSLARVLLEQTEGNPLYLEELVKTLAEEGVLKRGVSAWVAENASAEAARLAPSLSRILERRLASLAGGERGVLDLLAIFNRPVTVDLLAGALGLPVGKAAGRFAPLEQRHLVLVETDRAGASIVDLAHSRMREAVYRKLPEESRRRLHLSAGDAIAAAHGDSLDAAAEELAHHYHAAGDRPRTVDFAR